MSLFKSTLNTRALLPNSFKYIRSDVPSKISEEEIEWLLENNVTTIVDLRSASELLEKPCVLHQHSKFMYYNIPVTGGNIVPQSKENVPLSYFKMVDETMWKIIDKIENASSNVLYFCHAGKDRTGVVSALLLLRSGASHEEIVNDYVVSAENLKAALEDFAAQNPHVDLEIITPQKVFMQQFLEMVKFN